MAFAVPFALGATAIGAGITAFGQYQAGQARAAGYTSEADVAGKLAAAERQAGDVTEYAGFRASEATGLQYRAALGHQAVRFGEGIGGRTVADVRASQVALAGQAERETLAGSQERAFQERLTGAEQQTAAGRYATAARLAPVEGGIGALGSLVGGAGSVASKWYEASKLGPGSSLPYG